jgi:hypothetical protein
MDCPDGSIEVEHVAPITAIGVSAPQSGDGNLNTTPTYLDGGVVDAGEGVNGINLTGAAGVNGINLTGSGGVNGINLTGAGGINGISVTAVGGSAP